MENDQQQTIENLLNELNINSPKQIKERLNALSIKLLSLTNELCDRYKSKRASEKYYDIKNKLLRFLFRQTPLGKCTLMTVEQRLENLNMITLASDELEVLSREIDELYFTLCKVKRIEAKIKNNNN